MTEEALAELERLLTEMLAWAEARGEELYRLHAEVARLREALERYCMVTVKLASIKAVTYENSTKNWRGQVTPLEMDAHDNAVAILSTPAADWLAQHDAEVRERCAKIAEGWCRCSEPYPSMGLIDPGCDAHDIAGDIREQEADNDV